MAYNRSFGWLNFFTKRKNDWKIFVVCVLIAAVLWLLRSFSDTYTTEIDVAIQYENLPEDKTFTKKLPEKLSLLVKAQGWDLLAYKSKLNKPKFGLDLSLISNDKTFNTDQSKEFILESVDGLTDIIRIFPEEIDLNLEDASQKRVPIALNINYTLKNGYGLNGFATCNPDSVWIKGPKSVIAEIESINTSLVEFNDLDDLSTKEIDLKEPDGHVILAEKLTSVSLSVEKLTQKEILIPIKVINYRGNKQISLIPRQANVQFLCTLGNFIKVDKGDFEVYVDFINKTDDGLLEVTVTSSSELISGLRVHPKYVDFILE